MSNPVENASPFQSPEVRVVEASAGSGKTYALAKRYVQLILNPGHDLERIPIRNILALTFTNKAAFEMKRRILEFLKHIALKQLSPSQEKDILQPLGLNADQAGQKAFAVMEGIIRHFNFFQVQTIDKFINALLSGCAFKIGLTANFKIKTNTGEYLRYSLDELIDKAGQDKKVRKAFGQFIHHYLYLENRTGWFPKEDMLSIITALFEKANTYGLDFREGEYSSEDVVKIKRLILEDMKSLHGNLPEQTHAGFVKSLDKFLTVHNKSFDIDSVSDYFARDNFPVKKGADVPVKVEDAWKKIRTHLRLLCEREAYSLFNPYIHIFSQAMEGFFTKAAKDDCLFLNELNKRAGLLFDDERVTVEELYYRLATRFQHYLIDEFQDTSRLQWHNLEKMVEEGLSQGGTLFYVGDRKQAIYGFRGGDARLFDDIQRTFKSFSVQRDVLTDNWRSQKHIVEFNNAVFSVENLKRFIEKKETYEAEKNKKALVHFSGDDFEGLSRIFTSAQQACQAADSGGYVRLEYIDGDKKEDRDRTVREKLIALIRDLKGRFSYRDLAILTRGNFEIKEITRWLLEEGIPVESERTSDITENSLVRELIAFLTFLNSPIDNTAFAEFILGDVFTKATGFTKEEAHRFLFSLRGRLTQERDVYIYTEFREQHKKIWTSFMEEFFNNVGLYPLYELVITIYARFNILANSREHHGFLMHFLELIKRAEEEHTDIQSFLEYFGELRGEDLYVHITDSDAVRVMTIHKAKGLEFPVVLLPFLGMDIQIGSKGGEYQPSYILQPQKDGMELLRMKTKYVQFSGKLEQIYTREYKDALLSELNSIYVALTRPKYELYGFIPKKIGNSINIARFLVPEEQYCRGEQKKYSFPKRDDVSIDTVSLAVYPDWIDYLKDEFLEADQWTNRSQRLKGEVLHYALAQVGNLSVDDKSDVLNKAWTKTAQRFARGDHLPALEQQVSRLLDHADLRKFFYCGQAEVLTEREIVNRFGHTKRCDRLVVHEGEIWVIDFKSAENGDGLYAEQVREYKEVLKDIYPDKAIKGFLIYFDTLKTEEV